MNNSSVSRSNHSTRVLVSICFVILLCVVIALWFSKVNAANIVRRTVSMYLDEKQISYTSVHVNNQTLSVELQSSGEGRCTLDDVKAIQNIYTVIHAQSLADKIRNVKIEIVDRTGTVTITTILKIKAILKKRSRQAMLVCFLPAMDLQ